MNKKDQIIVNPHELYKSVKTVVKLAKTPNPTLQPFQLNKQDKNVLRLHQRHKTNQSPQTTLNDQSPLLPHNRSQPHINVPPPSNGRPKTFLSAAIGKENIPAGQKHQVNQMQRYRVKDPIKITVENGD